jgi:hypothetical protein
VSSKALTETERASLDLILEDFRFLFDKEEIKQDKVDEVLYNLKSNEVKSYIRSLRFGSKPEAALRESFIAGKSVLLKYLFGEALPEIRSNGFIDYLIKDEMGRGIALELKPFFEADVEFDKAGKPILKRLRQKKIKPEDYREQILKYIQEGEAQFVILTNLKDWFFYSKELTPRDVKPFCTIGFFEFVKEYDIIGNLRDYLERKEFESIRYELDKRFLESLKTWVKKLSEVEFTVDDKRKLELIIGLINKFIFVQTLDDYGVIEFNWIKKRWNYHEQMWQRKGKLMVLEKFFDELDDWFYLYYDTELFKEKILLYIKKDEENIDRLYRNLQLVLGLTYLQMPFGALKGIMQYNFRYIDEDVLGKAYETFLGEVRKEEGVYYTPKYITQYIAENTVGRVFDQLLNEIKEKLASEDLERVKDLVSKFISVRVLDPACGSGSFLIKAIRNIFNKYKELIKELNECYKKYLNYKGSLDLPQENTVKAELLSSIKHMLGPDSDRELIARILVRHIHGVDLDKRALEVAKVNIWLEAIKLSPKEFRYDRLPAYTNYILPTLEMNLCNGDSVVGLPEELAIRYLTENHQGDIIKLFDLRRKYLENPVDPKLVDEIDKVKNGIRKKLDEEFVRYLETKEPPMDIFNGTKPLHWPLEFWFVFFDKTGAPLQASESGFDVVIGNPPYVDYRLVKPISLHKFFKVTYQSCIGNKEKYNLYVVFIEKGVKLLRAYGHFAYINPIQVMSAYMALPLRKFLLTRYTVREIVDLSNVRVFEEAATYPILLFIDNREPTSNSKMRISYKTTEDEIIAREIKFKEVSQVDFAEREDKVILIDCRSEILKLIRRMDENKKLHHIIELKWGTSQSGYGKKKITKDKYDKLSDNEKQKYIPLAQSGDIVRYIINWQGEYIQRSVYPQKQLEQFLKPKVVISRQSLSMESGYDAEGFYALGKVAFTSFFKEKTPPKYLLALLNSNLLDFYFKKVYETLHMAGGYIRYDIPYLYELPIISWTDSSKKKLTEQIQAFIERIIQLKKAKFKFIDLWCEWCVRLKTSEHSLHDILTNDAELMRRGEFDKAWFSKVSFYPNSENAIINREFKRFKVNCDPDKVILKIYGQINQHTEELVYEIQFISRQLMEHIYLSLLQALTSKVKIKTFSDVLTKTIIPVIKEVNKSSNELTSNIVRKTKENFEQWLKEEGIDVEADIVKIDNEIEGMEAKIDALVFRLYGLNEDEMKIVFDSLKTPVMYQSKVFDFFRRL